MNKNKGYRLMNKLQILNKLICLCIINLSTVMSSYAALTAVTTNTIHGSSPYLTFDNGITKVTDASALLEIKLSNGVSYNTSNNLSSPTNLIELPVVGQTIADVQMLIPTTTNSINLGTLIAAPYNYWGDDEGDGQGANGISATGILSVQVQDSNGNTLNRGDSLNLCLTSYYKVTLSSTAGTLTTQYGNPNRTNYNAASATYYIKPKLAAPIACYAQPNLELSGASSDGPASQWDNTRGFKPQNINNPSSNFPTVGANNLFFNFSMVGTTWDTIYYDKTPNNSGIDLIIENGGNTNIAKITVKGPKYGDSVVTADTAVPTTFTIYSDSTKTNKIYSFTISKWFIARPGAGGGYNANYCSNTYGNSYRIPSVTEYTNANNTVQDWTAGLAGQGNQYQRRISGGLFAEWGNMATNTGSIYTSSDFDYTSYWASEAYFNSLTEPFERVAISSSGAVGSNATSETITRFSCVKP